MSNLAALTAQRDGLLKKIREIEAPGNGVKKFLRPSRIRDGISLKINKRYLWIEIRAYFGQIWIIIRIT